ncbi:uncharacterized protein MONOS_12798 [Monocercomonoides exilis]|uniref:uncharacterized protein n=1 Tax=Monocercomonoides exilis TaxID=2049356 RepID=UPI00355A2FED|nr:hypothetical protein MONOS_12798 [Monocercomonoides exilis]|eukprot:MONOS_12798.1-p1 / transcript=MONOS_12798.1 / gene=MONOS_12798 / organism=Monocercomonoides_exilis_PA203 / gene_product=unspecified product / transcript_product=unspecified product / location=Mono_scaffold00734:10063-10485(-) / protein_length=141 / sequence_SO=supercontig / SO=protein_coding / is_pseudo=false
MYIVSVSASTSSELKSLSVSFSLITVAALDVVSPPTLAGKTVSRLAATDIRKVFALDFANITNIVLSCNGTVQAGKRRGDVLKTVLPRRKCSPVARIDLHPHPVHHHLLNKQRLPLSRLLPQSCRICQPRFHPRSPLSLE